jgi:gentisate 1,2-dioxygenase
MPDLPTPELVVPIARDARTGTGSRWEPVALRRAEIAAAVDALLAGPRHSDDLRRLLVVHPRAGTGTGLAPGIEVAIEVLAPGETARAPRRNSTALAVQIRGSSEVVIDGAPQLVDERDVYTVPAMARQSHAATGNEPSVRLVFSNAALLELLGAHYVDQDASDQSSAAAPIVDQSVRNDGRFTQMAGSETFRLEYERVIDPPWVPFRSWLWRWPDVVEELDRMSTLGEQYNGRRVCVLYDPATGRTNGTTTTLFASMCIRPAGIIDRAHRHTAAAVNYFLDGSGWSTVDGSRIEWEGGDLVFIAPSWAVHHHASSEQPVYQLAVQDNPMHLAMGSLVWQEDLREPPLLLGTETGFTTNRDSVEPTSAS